MRWCGVALVLLCGMRPAFGAGTRLELDYDLRFGPIRLVEVRATVDLDGTRYEALTEMRTVGVVGTIFPWAASSRSTGWQTASGVRPEEHRSAGTFRGQTRVVEIDYAADGLVRARTEPPAEADWREPVPQSLQEDTVDPLSATLAVLGRDCAGTVRVFDGRRRYDLRLTDLGTEDLAASSEAGFGGAARRCRAVVEALAGFWRTDGRHSETPTTLDFWLVTPPGASRPLPVYLELAGRRGTLKIELVRLNAIPR